MPRNSSTGIYSKPAGDTAISGNVIDPNAWNGLTTDIGNEITNSLPRDGSAGMNAQLKLADGTTSAPGLAFGSEVNTGIYRKGAGSIAMAVGGTDLMVMSNSVINMQGHAIVSGADAGAISYFALSTPPVGFLKANGAAISRTVYANLFTAIGTFWGAGDGSTTFNVPDLRGYFPRGFDDGRGVDSGRTFGSAQADLFASHAHGVSDPGHAHSLYDPGHTHGVYDPGHAHNPSWGGGFVTVSAGVGNIGSVVGGTGLQGGTSTDTRGTGISIYGAGTGMSVYAAGTGIGIAAAGGGETRPKNIALLVCIKY